MRVWTENDGGRSQTQFKGTAGDCVTRAIAIATGKPYMEVYNGLWKENDLYRENHRDRVAKALEKKGSSPRNGVPMNIIKLYLSKLGWTWTPTMQVGSGCTVHLKADELPTGILIVRVSKHICAVIDGVINDTYDCSREGTRCVYGYWQLNK